MRFLRRPRALTTATVVVLAAASALPAATAPAATAGAVTAPAATAGAVTAPAATAGAVTAPAATAGAVTVPATAAGLTPTPPAGRLTVAGAPAIDEAALHAAQVQVVTLGHQVAVNGAAAQLQADQHTEAAQQASAARDQQLALSATAAQAGAARALASDTAAHASAVRAHHAAQAALARERLRLHGVAVQMYEGFPTPNTSVIPATATPGAEGTAAALQSAQDSAIAAFLVQSATDAIDRSVNQDVAAVSSTARHQRALAVAVARDNHNLASDKATAARASADLAGARVAVTAAQQLVAVDQQDLAAAKTALQKAVAALPGRDDTPVAAGDTSPSILGPSALDAAQLTSWFNASGYADLTGTPISQLARWYISEGNAEGVRGDIAFAQAVLETGGFSSPDSVDLNNYAGIGHCDSCSAGWLFPSPQMGVRGQIQLLRAYAQPGLTSAELASPPAIAGVTPEKQYRRGCCATWQSLTGVWATDPIYGPSILNLYLQMLDFALSQPPPAPPAPPTA